MTQNRTIVVTISRQMASGGAYLGYLLSRRLGYQYIDREVLHRAAEQFGVRSSDLSSVEERSTSFVESLIKGFVFGTPEAAYLPPSGRPVYDRELFEEESQIIRAAAERSNAVIIGRGGYAVLRGRPGVLNLFVHAPMDFRVRRYRRFHGLSAEAARAEIEESDRRREKFLKTMTETGRYDARNYHLCVDVHAAGFNAAENMVINLVEKTKQDLGL